DRQAAVGAEVDVLVELDGQGVGAVGYHADVAVGQRGCVGRAAHQVHRLAQRAVHVRARIAGKRQRCLGQPGELVHVHRVRAVHARRHVGDDRTAGIDAPGRHARTAVDHKARIAQVHVVANAHAGAVDDGIPDGDAVANLQVVRQVECQVRPRAIDLDVAVVVAEVHHAIGTDVVAGHGALAVHRYVPARVGGFADFLQLSQVDRVVIRGAIGQPGDLVAAHVDATAVDHRATIVDGDAVQVGQVTRHHQVQLVAFAVHAQVGAGGRLAGGQPAGNGQRGVVAQGLA